MPFVACIDIGTPTRTNLIRMNVGTFISELAKPELVVTANLLLGRNGRRIKTVTRGGHLDFGEFFGTKFFEVIIGARRVEVFGRPRKMILIKTENQRPISLG